LPVGPDERTSAFAAASFAEDAREVALDEVAIDAAAASSATPPPPPPAKPDDASTDDAPLGPALDAGDATATAALERVFNKRDFKRMRVIGQFNLGFILAALGDDVFIVDQHASDEIYNFERLQRVTTLNKQPLIVPARLDLTAAAEHTVRSNVDVFLANGFGFCELEERRTEAAAKGDAGGGCCLALKHVPFSKGTTFGPSDVHELIGMLDDGEYALPARSQLTVANAAPSTSGTTKPIGTSGGPSGPAGGLSVSGSVVRPSRVRAMLAMRACRSSVMIGAALDRRKMRRALDNLASLDAPWNCPHGRPTMRHLADLRTVSRGLGRAGWRKRGGKGGGGIGGW
jgi:DNA mismatch repair protein PMS2